MRIQLIYNVKGDEPDRGEAYFHCQKCLEEMPAGTSPKEWARQQAAIHPEGLQIWCTRHDLNTGSHPENQDLKIISPGGFTYLENHL